MGKEKYGKEEKQFIDLKHNIVCQICWRLCYGSGMSSCQQNLSLDSTDHVTADRNTRMNCEVNAILSGQIRAYNDPKLISQNFPVKIDNDPKHPAKAKRDVPFLRAKKWDFLQWPNESPNFNLTEQVFELLKTKLMQRDPQTGSK